MRVFVTVGSTQFDGLVEAVLRRETLEELYGKGYRQLVIQAGESKLAWASTTSWSDKLDISIWKYKPSLLDDFKEADLVISHAGMHRRAAMVQFVNTSQALGQSSRYYAFQNH